MSPAWISPLRTGVSSLQLEDALVLPDAPDGLRRAHPGGDHLVETHLALGVLDPEQHEDLPQGGRDVVVRGALRAVLDDQVVQIGRASCRESGLMSDVTESLKHQT